jgi:hypothetical protein
MASEVSRAMEELYDCPDCDRTHAEPAAAAYVLRARCLDCELESLRRKPARPRVLLAAA